jgi:tRNA G18 (ribose-2'-O)-methylase SpoU
LTLPMMPGVDSLNVAVTAGIFLHHFARELVPGIDCGIRKVLI